jgi:hypothetical protein
MRLPLVVAVAADAVVAVAGVEDVVPVVASRRDEMALWYEEHLDSVGGPLHACITGLGALVRHVTFDTHVLL